MIIRSTIKGTEMAIPGSPLTHVIWDKGAWYAFHLGKSGVWKRSMPYNSKKGAWSAVRFYRAHDRFPQESDEGG